MTWLHDATLEHLRQVADWPDLSGTRYRIIEALGQGGMGAVYLAEDTELQREVALKVLRDPVLDAAACQRMIREARILARLEHPGIVPVHDLGQLPDGRMFYVMKRIRGPRLDQHVSDATSLPDRLRLFERICETVAFAHAHGVIHRDLKPQNIMVGEFGEVLVLDWGVAKLQDATVMTPHDGAPPRPPRPIEHATARNAPPPTGSTVTLHPGGMSVDDGPRTRANGTADGTVIGTLAYMSPEQARGEVDRIDARSDVFSLGGILYFLLTLRPPRADPDGAGEIKPPRRIIPGLPRPLVAVCMKALAADPHARYTAVADLTRDVSRFLSGQPVIAYRERLVERIARLARVYRTPILLIVTYLVVRVLMILLARR